MRPLDAIACLCLVVVLAFADNGENYRAWGARCSR